jgi:hypothetical protein
VINIDFIKEKTNDGLFTWNECTALVCSVIGLIRRVQAPERNDKLKALWDDLKAEMDACPKRDQTAVFCKALRFLSERSYLLDIDAMNSRLVHCLFFTTSLF